MERNWDPEVKKFFLKILNSVCLGLLWMMAAATAGIYYRMGYQHGQPVFQVILFYVIMLATFLLLLRYLYNTWKGG